MKNIVVVTGGAGFVGSNLIKFLINKTKYKIISIDNYSSGSKKNHIQDKRVQYKKTHTKNISIILNKYKKNLHSIFHFGEFARIYQSFKKMNDCIQSNTIGSNAVFDFCLKNRIKLIYSNTSASLGNRGRDKNLSPYAFTKAKNLEFLENLKKWFDFKYEVIFFYNVYGPNQISNGNMATVIGIFENCYLKNKPLPVVKPIAKQEDLHIDDTIQVCYKAWKKNNCKYYSISNKKSYSILQVANLFKSKIKYLPPRQGERYASALSTMTFNNRVNRSYGKIDLRKYVESFIKKHKKSKKN